MKRKTDQDQGQIAIRVSSDWIRRADALVPSFERPGIKFTRTEVLRAALAEGLVKLEGQFGIVRKAATKVEAQVATARSARKGKPAAAKPGKKLGKGKRAIASKRPKARKGR